MRKMWKSVIAAVFTLSTVVSSVVMPTAVSAADAAIPLPELRVEGFESYAAGTALDVRYPVNGGLYYTNNTATAAVIEMPIDDTTGLATDNANKKVSGTKRVELVPLKDGDSQKAVGVKLAVTEGETYQVRATVRARDDSSSRQYYIRCWQNSGTILKTGPAKNSSGDWVDLELDYTSTVTGTLYFEVFTWKDGFVMDDFYVHKVAETTDGTFETGEEGVAMPLAVKGLGTIYSGFSTSEVVKGISASGSRSLKYERTPAAETAGAAAYISKTAELKAGVTYVISAKVRKLETMSDKLYRIRAYKTSAEPSPALPSNGIMVTSGTSGDDWITIECEYTSEIDNTIRFEVAGWNDGGYVDDFIIYDKSDVPDPTPEPVMINTSDSTFESCETGGVLPVVHGAYGDIASGELYAGWSTAEIVDTASVSGSKSVKFVRTEEASAAGAGAYIGVTADLKAGVEYTVTANVKRLETISGSEQFHIRALSGGAALDPDVAWCDHAVLTVADDAWHTIKYKYTSNIDNKVSFQVAVWNDGGYVDDFCIYEGDEPVEYEFGISDVSFTYSADGESFVTAGKTNVTDGIYKYTIIANNPTEEDAEFTPIIALYDADNVLVSVNVNQTTVAAGDVAVEIPVTLAVSGAAQGAYIKTFVWNLATMTPYDVPALKVLIIGNSITQHDASAAIGWNGSWGMAATSEDSDYVHQLITLAKAENNNLDFQWKNISEFEKYFYDFSLFNTARYDDYVNYDADIIIAAFGANIKNGANEQDSSYDNDMIFNTSHYKNIVNYFNPNGTATVIVGLTTLTSTENITVITDAAEEEGWAVVDMSDLTDEIYLGSAHKDAEVFSSDVSAGVLAHPGDEGMKVMAERLWTALEPVIASKK